MLFLVWNIYGYFQYLVHGFGHRVALSVFSKWNLGRYRILRFLPKTDWEKNQNHYRMKHPIWPRYTARIKQNNDIFRRFSIKEPRHEKIISHEKNVYLVSVTSIIVPRVLGEVYAHLLNEERREPQTGKGASPSPSPPPWPLRSMRFIPPGDSLEVRLERRVALGELT